jgi:lysosomal Pro-X carboxypeptidase
MFYCPPDVNCSNWDITSQADGCRSQWGVTPRPEWANVMLGGKRIKGASNIVFSNGMQDPWHGGGILQNISDTVVAITIPDGAHHIDLMFTDPADAEFGDIAAAREFERAFMRQWVAEAEERYALGGESTARSSQNIDVQEI